MVAFRKLILFISVALATVLCVNAQKVLRWGADPSGGAPYVFNDPNHPDQYIGYEKEMVDALAVAMNRKPEFVPSDWETLVSALQRGSFDVIVNGLEPTADRAKQIQFSKPYYIFQLALTVRKGEGRINSLADCRDRVVGTLGNTAASRLLQKEGIPSEMHIYASGKHGFAMRASSLPVAKWPDRLREWMVDQKILQ